MVGSKFGMVTVISKTDIRSGTHRLWQCSCDCGRNVLATMSDLRTGRRKSCGCLKGANLITNGAHIGGKRMPEYGIWAGMKERCSNPKCKKFERYGSRGISVCEDWQDFASFLKDMGRRPSRDHSLDRRDNDGNYEPGNCRWVVLEVQANNKSTNVFLTIDGEKRSLTQWSKVAGIHQMTIRYRASRHFAGNLVDAIKYYLARAT